jgi:hypothetical protein
MVRSVRMWNFTQVRRGVLLPCSGCRNMPSKRARNIRDCLMINYLLALLFNPVGMRSVSLRNVRTHLQWYNSEDHSMLPLSHSAFGRKREEHSVGLTTHLHLTSRLGMHGAIPLLPTCIHSVLLNQLIQEPVLILKLHQTSHRLVSSPPLYSGRPWAQARDACVKDNIYPCCFFGKK